MSGEPKFIRATKTSHHYQGQINGKPYVVPHSYGEKGIPIRHAIITARAFVAHHNPDLTPEELARVHSHINGIHGGQEMYESYATRPDVGRGHSQHEVYVHKNHAIRRLEGLYHIYPPGSPHESIDAGVSLQHAKSIIDKLPKTVKEEEDPMITEKKLTAPEVTKKEEIVRGMKKNLQGFKERYGKRAKEVMHATAAKKAKELAEGHKYDNAMSGRLPAHLTYDPKSEDIQVGDKVHLGFGHRGGAGYTGTVHKIEGNQVHVKTGDARIVVGPRKHVTLDEEVSYHNESSKFMSTYRRNESQNRHTANILHLATHFGSKADQEQAKFFHAELKKHGHQPHHEEAYALHQKLWPKAVKAHELTEELKFKRAGSAYEAMEKKVRKNDKNFVPSFEHWKKLAPHSALLKKSVTKKSTPNKTNELSEEVEQLDEVMTPEHLHYIFSKAEHPKDAKKAENKGAVKSKFDYKKFSKDRQKNPHKFIAGLKEEAEQLDELKKHGHQPHHEAAYKLHEKLWSSAVAAHNHVKEPGEAMPPPRRGENFSEAKMSQIEKYPFAFSKGARKDFALEKKKAKKLWPKAQKEHELTESTQLDKSSESLFVHHKRHFDKYDKELDDVDPKYRAEVRRMRAHHENEMNHHYSQMTPKQKSKHGPHFRPMQEEVEQLDELKKSTLKSYIKKAAHEIPQHERNAQRMMTYAQLARSRQAAKRYDQVADKAFSKVEKRERGIKQAADKLEESQPNGTFETVKSVIAEAIAKKKYRTEGSK
jgi:hypothetical protein